MGLYSFDFMGGYCCTNGYSFTHLFEIDKKFYNVANDQSSFYILVILSGIMMVKYSIEQSWILAIFKILMGIIVIGVVEMLLSYRKQQKPTGMFLMIFVIVVVITISLGFYLSGGYPLFN